MAALDLDSGIDLEQLGLPIANTENKILETEVQKKQNEISTHDLKISDNKERVQAISDHLRNVKQELQHTQVWFQTFAKSRFLLNSYFLYCGEEINFLSQ